MSTAARVVASCGLSPSYLNELTFFPIIVLASCFHEEHGDIPMGWDHFDDSTIVPSTRLALLALLYIPIIDLASSANPGPLSEVLLL